MRGGYSFGQDPIIKIIIVAWLLARSMHADKMFLGQRPAFFVKKQAAALI